MTTFRSTIFSKAIWESKTLWFNALALAALALDSATAANLPFIGSEWFAFAVIMVNALLRFLTTIPVTVQGGDPVDVEQKP
jgi:hypothetical protein